MMQLPWIGKVRQPAPWLLGLIAAGVLGAGTVYWMVRHSAKAPDLTAMTVPVESQSLRLEITASGVVQPIQTVNLSPKSAGIVAELYVEQGDRVQKGQVIARMENRDVAAQIAQAQARVAQAEAKLAEVRAGNRSEDITQAQARVRQADAQLAQSQARLDLANQKVARNQALAQEGAISRDRLDEFLNEAATARADLAQSRARLREQQDSLALLQQGSRVEEIALAEAQLAEAQGNLQSANVQQDDTLVRAPFSGTITQKFATEGAFVTPTTSASEATSATSTAIVALAEGLEVLADVPEVDIKQLRTGQRVEISADAYPNETFQGRVRLIAPEAVIKQNVTSFQVRVELETGQTRLRSGMNADVVFIGNEVNDALVVPTVAIVTQRGKTGVLMPDEANQPKFHPVELGIAVGDQTQVIKGIESGDRVFTDLPPNSDWNKPKSGEI